MTWCCDQLMVRGAIALACIAGQRVSWAGATHSDFNGDGYSDLAIGVPFESDGSKIEAGAVNVIYGGVGGLSAMGNQFWSQDSAGVTGSAHANDQFGSVLATGDFDGDGYSDLAIG